MRVGAGDATGGVVDGALVGVVGTGGGTTAVVPGCVVRRGAVGATGSATTRTTGAAVRVDHGVGAAPMLTGAPVGTTAAGLGVRPCGRTGPPPSAHARPADPMRAAAPTTTTAPWRRGALCRPISEVWHSEGRRLLVAAWAG